MLKVRRHEGSRLDGTLAVHGRVAHRNCLVPHQNIGSLVNNRQLLGLFWLCIIFTLPLHRLKLRPLSHYQGIIIPSTKFSYVAALVIDVVGLVVAGRFLARWLLWRLVALVLLQQVEDEDRRPVQRGAIRSADERLLDTLLMGCAPGVRGAENLTPGQLLERVRVLSQKLVSQVCELLVVRAHLGRARRNEVPLVQVELWMLLLEVQQQVLKQFLIFHEQVESVREAFDLFVVLLGEIELRLYGENFLILVEDLLEDLQVVKFDFRGRGVLVVISVFGLVGGPRHALQLVGRAATTLVFVRSAGSVPRDALVKVRDLLLVAVCPVLVDLDLMR